MRRAVLSVLAAIVALGSAAEAQTPLGTTFTYQGELKSSGQPASGPVDLRFTLFDAPTAGAAVGTMNERTGVSLAGGRFAQDLDFGPSAFGAAARWLEIAVRSPAGAGSYVTLSPRQRITPAPSAVFAARPWETSGTTISYGAGNVGIGTTSPTSRLEIAAQDGLAISGFQPFITLRDTNAGGQRALITTGNGDLGFYANSSIGGWPTLIIKNSSGNVGIGTPSPSFKLDVVGNARVSGNLTTGPVTRYKSIHGASFLPNVVSRDSGGFSLVSTSGAIGYGFNNEFVAPVELPHAAVVTEFRVYAVDSRTGADCVVTLGRTEMATGQIANMATVTTAGSSTAVQNLATGSVVWSTILNHSHVYWIAARMDSFGNEQHRIIAARITYTVTEPQP